MLKNQERRVQRKVSPSKVNHDKQKASALTSKVINLKQNVTMKILQSFYAKNPILKRVRSTSI